MELIQDGNDELSKQPLKNILIRLFSLNSKNERSQQQLKQLKAN